LGGSRHGLGDGGCCEVGEPAGVLFEASAQARQQRSSSRQPLATDAGICHDATQHGRQDHFELQCCPGPALSEQAPAAACAQASFSELAPAAHSRAAGGVSCPAGPSPSQPERAMVASQTLAPPAANLNSGLSGQAGWRPLRALPSTWEMASGPLRRCTGDSRAGRPLPQAGPSRGDSVRKPRGFPSIRQLAASATGHDAS
jgi:hypothetical protein